MAKEDRNAIIPIIPIIHVDKIDRAKLKWIHIFKRVIIWKNKQKMDNCEGFLKFI
jgi:hypothetical protein